jgi:benzylsuccinate synthase
MTETNYFVDPVKAGVTLGTAGQPTPRGWQVVTPDTWHFRNNQIADKAQTVEGYWDKDWWCDCTKTKAVVGVYENNPMLTPGELTAMVDEVIFAEQNIVIRPNELFVGRPGNDEHALVYDPRFQLWGTYAEMYGKGKCFIWENGKKVPVSKELNEQIKKFNFKHNPEFKIKPMMTEREYKMYMANLRYWQALGTDGLRANPDHVWFMNIGLRGLVDIKKQTLERLEKECDTVETDKISEKRHIIADCRASITATEAVIKWIKRHAETASNMAKEEVDPKERHRLETIASNCAWVAENPPRTFPEAMQLHWLCFMAYYSMEVYALTISFRPDQVFWQWYEKDVLIDKSLTRAEAADYVAFYMMRSHEIGFLVSLEMLRKAGMGTREYSTITIGGQTADGQDATNDLSMLILDVIDGYRLHYPDVKMRWHRKFNENNFKRTVEVMRTGMGIPSFRNDEVAITAFRDQYGDEVSLEEARSWAVVGCITPGVTINSKGVTMRAAQFVNCMKALEFTLFNGVDPEPGFEWGKSIETGDPATFKDYEEFYQAWLKQWDWLVSTEIKLRNIVWNEIKNDLRRPFLSMLYKRSVEEGIDAQALDGPKLSFQDVPGWVETIDSLAAIKKMIYEDKKYTIAEFTTALKADWEGYEDMRQDFIDVPKFGNNEDYVDQIFARGVKDVNTIARHVLDDRGKPTFPSGLIISMMYLLADRTGAMPNGRKRGDALCDGGINPYAPYDKGGPWDRLSSALKVDQTKFKAWIYNQKFDYPTVEGEAGLEKLVDYTKAGLEGGMDQMQYNFMSRDILHDAQKHPENYPYLSVRISGYSAFFTQLPEFVQNSVIDRVDHEL